MHACFNIAELRMAIALECYDEYWQRLGHGTLLSLSLTCKLFYEPCMAVLWHRVGDLRSLLRCLSAITSTPGEDDAQGNGLPKLRAIFSSEKDRFMKYASRVREYGPSVFDVIRPRIPVETYRVLFLISDGTLFPQVRKAVLDDIRSENLPFLRMLMHPGVRELGFKISQFITPTNMDYLSYRAFFSTLPSMTSLVTLEMDLSLLGSAQFTPQIIHAAISSLSNLQRLTLEPTTIDIVPHIALLPSLQELSLRIIPDEDEDSSDNFTHFQRRIPTNFQRRIRGLKKLKIDCYTPEELIWLLRHLAPGSPLQEIAIQITEETGTVTQWTDMIEEIGLRCDESTLKQLQIGDLHHDWEPESSDDPEDRPHFALTFAHLKPLLKFSAMDTINIFCSGRIDLDDAAMDTIGSSFPNITHVVLLGRYSPGAIPKATLSGLFSMCRHWPKLDTLDMAFDARSAPLSGPEAKYICPKLEFLDVQYSPIENPLSVAAYLSDIFPALHSVYSTRREHYAKKWTQMADAVPEFARVRTEEIRRARSTRT